MARQVKHLLSPAKINIFLSINGKMEDGYHKVHTLMSEIDFFDEIIAENTNNVVSIEFITKKKDLGPYFLIPDKQDNICYKVVSLIKDHFKIKNGVKIKIIKSIPLGSGLGGGSSNGSTVLKLINDMWKLSLSKTELEKLGSSISVDLPFFITGGMKIMKGRGDIVEEKIVVNSPFYGVLVIPPIHISSSYAYKIFDENNKFNYEKRKEEETIYKLKNAILNRDIVKFVEFIKNDFENCILNYYPILKIIKNLMIKSGCLSANISGSGSSLWGICRNEEETNSVIENLRRILPSSYIKEKITFPLFLSKNS